MASATLHSSASLSQHSQPLARAASSHSHAVHRTPADSELIERINQLRLMHETSEQQFKQEIQTVQQQQTVELAAVKIHLKNSQEMHEKLLLEREALIQRVRQLENVQPAIAPRPSALPLGLPSNRAAIFVQTVLGIHYEPLGIPLPQERGRPVRQSAAHKERALAPAKDDSANEKESRRSSKRQKPVAAKTEPAAAGHLLGVDDASVPLVAKSGTRIRLKPIAVPKGMADDEDSLDYSVADSNVGESTTGIRAGMKRPRSPASSIQTPAKPTKKRATTSTAARNKISIPPIPRAVDGSPLLPMQIGIFTLKNLGRIHSTEDLANERTIYPIGYRVERRWFSTVDPKALVNYVCLIEAGDTPQRPVFVVIPEDSPRKTGHTATAAWWEIYKEGIRVRNQPEQAVMNGDEMFGLWDNVIKALIQELPGANTVENYVWRTFVEVVSTSKKRSATNTVYHIESPTRTEDVNDLTLPPISQMMHANGNGVPPATATPV